MTKLKQKTIKKRLIRLRNLERLHEKAKERITLQDKEVKSLKKTVALQQEIMENQSQIIEKLKLEVEELRKIVFGKKKPPQGKEKDNHDKEEGAKGKKPRTRESYQRAIPKEEEITQEKYHATDNCPDCGTKLKKKRIIIFYEEDIPLPQGKPLKEVIKHRVEKGYCPRCKKWHSAIPLPSSKVIIGKNTRLYLCYLSIILRLSYEQTTNLFRDTYNFSLSDGEIGNILEKESIKLSPAYERLKEAVRNQKGVHLDETPWRVQRGHLGNYAWTMSGAQNDDAVFVLGQSRGKRVAEKLLEGSQAVGISDDYGAYKHLFSSHQLCWAHPHRKLRDLANSEKLEKEKQKHCQAVFQKFRTLYQKLQVSLAEKFHLEKREKTRKQLMEKFDEITLPSSDDPHKLKKIKESLKKNKAKYFTCLLYPDIPADNNKAERSLRHLVLKRKISLGSKTQKGADRTGILLSVLMSFWKKYPNDFFRKLGEV